MIHHIGPSPGHPNVLLIITDQQRADAVGYETPWVVTPHIDRLAAESVICPLAFVQSPQCQPSRASLFTGRYPTAHKVWWNGIQLPKSELTIANHLREAGYRTGYFGKMHFGDGNHTAIARHFGFDHSFLYEDWAGGLSLFKTRAAVEREFYGPMGSKTWTGQLTNRELHHEEVITREALSFLADSTSPFFCVVSYHGPHPPYAAPDEFSDWYNHDKMSVPVQKVPNPMGHTLSDNEWRALKVQYYGAVSWIDSCVGRLIDAIGRNTIVIYTSDHGDILGDHGLFSKGVYAYDGNTRVPLLMRMPQLKPGHYRHLVQSIDVMPTLLKACGLATPSAIQGKNLLEAVSAGRKANDYVLSMIGHLPRLRMLRTVDYKYWVVGGSEFLYDLVADPTESVRLVGHPMVSKLRLALLNGLIQAEDPLPQPV